jgi:hypothetical protein
MADEALIYSYRDAEARELMARYWCQKQYNGDTRPEIMQMIKEDLEGFNRVQLAYLYREAGGGRATVRQLADNYDPWAK